MTVGLVISSRERVRSVLVCICIYVMECFLLSKARRIKRLSLPLGRYFIRTLCCYAELVGRELVALFDIICRSLGDHTGPLVRREKSPKLSREL